MLAPDRAPEVGRSTCVTLTAATAEGGGDYFSRGYHSVILYCNPYAARPVHQVGMYYRFAATSAEACE